MKKISTFLLLLIVTVNNLQAQKDYEYLPREIFMNRAQITFSYDNKNRIIEMKKNTIQEIHIDSIFYRSTNDGLILTKTYYESRAAYKQKTARESTKYYLAYTKDKDHQTFYSMEDVEIYNKNLATDKTDESVLCRFEFNTSGKPIRMISDSRNSIDFKYDANKNIKAWKPSEYNTYKGIFGGTEELTFSYDNKKGMFKNVDQTPLIVLFGIEFPYIFFFQNNLTKMSDLSKGDSVSLNYKYDSNGYPTTITSENDTSWDMTISYRRIGK